MLIKKGDIYRNIDGKRLSEYKEKGYERVEDAENSENDTEKAIGKMNAEELAKKAEDLGVDISSAKTNKEKAQVILDYIDASASDAKDESND